MAVEIQIRPNPLTNPPSYSAQVRPQGTTSFDNLVELTARAANLPEPEVRRILSHFIEIVGNNLIEGNNVHIAGLGSLGLSVSARIDSPTAEVPANSSINIVSRAAPDLVKRVRNEAKLIQVPDRNREPILAALNVVQGDPQALKAGNLIQITGDNLNFNVANPDEGVFLVMDGRELQAQVYERGRKKLSFFLPEDIPSGLDVSIEVRARTRNTTARSTLRVGHMTLTRGT